MSRPHQTSTGPAPVPVTGTGTGAGAGAGAGAGWPRRGRGARSRPVGHLLPWYCGEMVGWRLAGHDWPCTS